MCTSAGTLLGQACVEASRSACRWPPARCPTLQPAAPPRPQLELASKQSELQRITADVALLRRRSAAELQRLRTTLAATGLVQLPPVAPSGLGQQPDQPSEQWHESQQGPPPPLEDRFPPGLQQQLKQRQLEQQDGVPAWVTATGEVPDESRVRSEQKRSDGKQVQLNGAAHGEAHDRQADEVPQQQQQQEEQEQEEPWQAAEQQEQLTLAAEQRLQADGDGLLPQQAAQQPVAEDATAIEANGQETNGHGPAAAEQTPGAAPEEGEAKQRWRFGLEPEPREHPAWVQETAAGGRWGGSGLHGSRDKDALPASRGMETRHLGWPQEHRWAPTPIKPAGRRQGPALPTWPARLQATPVACAPAAPHPPHPQPYPNHPFLTAAIPGSPPSAAVREWTDPAFTCEVLNAFPAKAVADVEEARVSRACGTRHRRICAIQAGCGACRSGKLYADQADMGQPCEGAGGRRRRPLAPQASPARPGMRAPPCSGRVLAPASSVGTEPLSGAAPDSQSTSPCRPAAVPDRAGRLHAA